MGGVRLSQLTVHSVRSLFGSMGRFSLFAGSVARVVARRKLPLRSLLQQMERTGIESLTVVNLCAFFIGIVLVAQIASMLARFGAKTEVSTVIGLAFVREIGPVFAAIMFTGRIGTGIAAELSSMMATEQIDALRLMGVDPIARLVAPRVVASVIMLPALTVVADMVGLFSGMVAGLASGDFSPAQFMQKAIESLRILDVVASVSKAAAFGLLVGLTACWIGMGSDRSSASVGVASTRTMVAGVLGILISDFLLTTLFIRLGGN